MFKRTIGHTIGLGLLCMAGHAYSANIVVNTTDDEDGIKNDKCSLREAIALINSTDASGKIPANTDTGCATPDAAPSIVLEAGKTYTIHSEIKIKQSLQLNVLDSGGLSSRFRGENNAIIKTSGKGRIFSIDDENPGINNITVTINEVNLVGCGSASCRVDNGGLINNRENLSLSYSQLSGGYAKNGGAIYNEGVASNVNVEASAGLLNLNNVVIFNNTAEQGAALYSVQPRYDIFNSVIRDNKLLNFNPAVMPAGVGDNTGFTLFVSRSGIFNDTTGNARTGNIRNSTIFHNQGWVANLLDAMVINNATIILNDGGIYLNSPNGFANFSNSIIADNGPDGSRDCLIPDSNKAVTNNLVYRGGECQKGQASDTKNPNRQLGTRASEPLIAGSEVAKAADTRQNAVCSKPPANGLLCPFGYQKEVFTGFFKPRLLASYSKLSDSPIVNRGRVFSDGSTAATLLCEGNDQRGRVRETTVLCDIGAIELAIEEQSKIGQDIKYGQNAQIDITDNLGDGELWPASRCDAVFSDVPASLRPVPLYNKPWQDGCLSFVTGKETTKGELILSDNALLKYLPFRNYHGSDNFSINVVTSTSRFSEGVNDRSITLNGTIVQEPERVFSSKSVKLSGGASGLAVLIGLLGLAGVRRRLQGVK